MIRVLFAMTIALAITAGAAKAVSFARADRDNDGVVTYKEIRSTMPKLSNVHFSKCDRDKNTVITQNEFACVDALYSIIRLND